MNTAAFANLFHLKEKKNILETMFPSLQGQQCNIT